MEKQFWRNSFLTCSSLSQPWSRQYFKISDEVNSQFWDVFSIYVVTYWLRANGYFFLDYYTIILNAVEKIHWIMMKNIIVVVDFCISNCLCLLNNINMMIQYNVSRYIVEQTSRGHVWRCMMGKNWNHWRRVKRAWRMNERIRVRVMNGWEGEREWMHE